MNDQQNTAPIALPDDDFAVGHNHAMFTDAISAFQSGTAQISFHPEEGELPGVRALYEAAEHAQALHEFAQLQGQLSDAADKLSKINPPTPDSEAALQQVMRYLQADPRTLTMSIVAAAQQACEHAAALNRDDISGRFNNPAVQDEQERQAQLRTLWATVAELNRQVDDELSYLHNQRDAFGNRLISDEQLAEFRRRQAEIDRLPVGDPRRVELERQLGADERRVVQPILDNPHTPDSVRTAAGNVVRHIETRDHVIDQISATQDPAQHTNVAANASIVHEQPAVAEVVPAPVAVQANGSAQTVNAQTTVTGSNQVGVNTQPAAAAAQISSVTAQNTQTTVTGLEVTHVDAALAHSASPTAVPNTVAANTSAEIAFG